MREPLLFRHPRIHHPNRWEAGLWHLEETCQALSSRNRHTAKQQPTQDSTGHWGSEPQGSRPQDGGDTVGQDSAATIAMFSLKKLSGTQLWG